MIFIEEIKEIHHHLLKMPAYISGETWPDELIHDQAGVTTLKRFNIGVDK